MEKKTIDFIDLELKVKLPTQYYRFLRELGQLVKRSPEDILTEEMYGVLRCFITGGALDAWLESVGEDFKELEDLAEELEAQVYKEAPR